MDVQAIYKHAMQLELDGEKYYRDLEKKTSDPGLKTILTLLADEEVKHFKALKAMCEDDQVEVTLNFADVYFEVKNIFEEMAGEKREFQFSKDEVALYQKAQEIEDNADKFYADKAEDVSSESAKKLLLRLSEEEKKHADLLGDLADFVAAPSTWMADAEWSNIGE